jgi:hypothetical protein
MQQVIQIALGVFLGGGMIVMATLALRHLSTVTEPKQADRWALWCIVAVSLVVILMAIAVRPALALP